MCVHIPPIVDDSTPQHIPALVPFRYIYIFVITKTNPTEQTTVNKQAVNLLSLRLVYYERWGAGVETHFQEIS